MSKTLSWIMTLAAVVMAAALSTLAYQDVRQHSQHAGDTAYHAVVLANGQAFFGRISNLGSDYPMLEDVFYIQSRVINAETKQVANVLVKRGRELHEPDRMILNRQTVMFIEPVKADSQVAKLIAEQNK